MRHFVRGKYHWAGVTESVVSDWTELPEGPDGKCDWCRAADEARKHRELEAQRLGIRVPYEDVLD